MLTLEDFNLKKYETVLSTGHKLLLLERSGSPIFIKIVTRFGSVFDPNGKNGLSHFLEHILANGSKNYPTKDQLSNLIYSVGDFYFSTSKEFITLVIKVADKDSLDNALTFISEALFNPIIDEKNVSTERSVISHEISSKSTNSELRTIEEWYRMVFQDTKLHLPNTGTLESIKGITVEDVLEFYKRLLEEKFTIIVSGDVDFNLLKDEFEKIFFHTKPNKEKFIPKVELARKNPIIILENKNSEHLHFEFCFKTCSFTSDDRDKLKLLSNLLANNRSAILTKLLRYNNSLVYTISIELFYLLEFGFFTFFSDTDRKDFNKVFSIICEEIKRLKVELMDFKLIEIEKNKIMIANKIGFETSESVVDFHTRYAVYFEHTPTADEIINKMLAITAQDLREVINTYFHENNSYLLCFGDFGSEPIRIDL